MPKQNAQMSERQLQYQVERLARLRGFRYYHAPDVRLVNGQPAQRVVAGWPDLVLVRKGRLIFAELKAQTGRLSPAQRDWLTDLEATGAECYVWKPEHLTSGEIAEVLSGRKRS